MEQRNYKLATKCSLCELPFSSDEEGIEKELAGTPVKLCGKCWSGMIETVEEQESHMVIFCPECETEIGIRVETTNDP